jgi:hypothetical protein
MAFKMASFSPERILFRPDGVNLRGFLCGVPMYASAQPLDFLPGTKNDSFPNRNLAVCGVFIRGFCMGTGLISGSRRFRWWQLMSIRIIISVLGTSGVPFLLF